ncbi:MAG: ribose 5-phosphate isomerase B [Nitrospirae bacterium]|nr:ribose 5-phosphate isomerase B [Nitrospirota bacterium]
MKIAIASDHGGCSLKEKIVELLKEKGLEVTDYGVDNPESVDYPDYGIKVADAVSKGVAERGILSCGTGIGMSIVANKFPGVRAALCHDLFTARMSRLHNDANILVLGGRVLDMEVALLMVGAWLTTDFEGGRHQRRLDKISEIEKGIFNRRKNG